VTLSSRDELKLGSRVTLSLNLTVYAKILHGDPALLIKKEAAYT